MGWQGQPEPILVAIPMLPSTQDRCHRGQQGTGVTTLGAEAEWRCLRLRYRFEECFKQIIYFH